MTREEFAAMAIRELGGPTAVGKMLAIDQRVVSNWPSRGFPPDCYCALAPLLAARGIAAPPGMFGQRALMTSPPRRRRTKQEPQHASG